MARRKRRQVVAKPKGKPMSAAQEVAGELPVASERQLKPKKVVKTIHFDKADVDGLTSRAEALGLTFSAYLRMLGKKDLLSV